MVWVGISGPTSAIDSYVFYMYSVFIVLLDSFCLVDSPFLVSHGMPTQIYTAMCIRNAGCSAADHQQRTSMIPMAHSKPC